jgi:lipopolysaccharide export system permease protein
MPPMSCTTRYMLRQLFWPLLLAGIAIAGIVWMSQSLRFVDLVLNRGLPAHNLFYLAFLVLPMFTSVFLPVVLFGAVVFAYTKMAMDSELVIWRACGMSQMRLARPAVVMAFTVMAAAYSLNLYFMPAAYREFKDIQHAIRHNYSQVLLREGTFNEIGKSLTVYIRSRSPEGELFGILVHDRSDPKQPVTMMAERGAVVRAAAGPRVVMVNGNRQIMNASKEELSILYFERYTLDLTSKAEATGPRWREPRERFLSELFELQTAGPHAAIDKRFRSKLAAEGHQRLVTPWLALAFTLIALAALLTGDFNRRGQGRRLLAASIAMIVLQSASISLHSLADKSPAAVPLMYLTPAVTIALCLWLLARSQRGRHVTDVHDLAARV